MTGASLSVVVPCFNEAEIIRETHRRFAESLAGVSEPVEFVYVDDGSVDATLELLRELRDDDDRVRVLSLSRNFGQEIAQFAGLAAASGGAVVVIDADLQDPPEVIREMLDRWKDGADVVYGVRTGRDGDSVFRRFMAGAFYRMQRRLASVDVPVNAGNFRLMDRKVVDALLAMPDHYPFLRAMTPWIGFRHEPVHFRRQTALMGRRSKHSLRTTAELAAGVLLFSARSARVVFVVGLLLLLLAVAALPLGDAVAGLLGAGAAGGWKIVLVAFLCVGGLQLLALGILCEQLGHVQREAMARPLYFVRERIGFDEGGDP